MRRAPEETACFAIIGYALRRWCGTMGCVSEATRRWIQCRRTLDDGDESGAPAPSPARRNCY